MKQECLVHDTILTTRNARHLEAAAKHCMKQDKKKNIHLMAGIQSTKKAFLFSLFTSINSHDFPFSLCSDVRSERSMCRSPLLSDIEAMLFCVFLRRRCTRHTASTGHSKKQSTKATMRTKSHPNLCALTAEFRSRAEASFEQES